MATKAKKNPRWLVVLEDVWAGSADAATKADLLHWLSDLDDDGFKVVKVTKQPPVAK